MISRGSNPAGEIREAALGSPEVWPCSTAELKGTKKRWNPQHSPGPGPDVPLDALRCSGLCKQGWPAAPRQVPTSLGHTASMELWSSTKENTQCLDGQDWTGVFLKKCGCPSGKWCSALTAECRTQNSLLQESSCLNQMSTVWGCVLIHPNQPCHLPTPGCLSVSSTQTWQIFKKQSVFLHSHYH